MCGKSKTGPIASKFWVESWGCETSGQNRPSDGAEEVDFRGKRWSSIGDYLDLENRVRDVSDHKWWD